MFRARLAFAAFLAVLTLLFFSAGHSGAQEPQAKVILSSRVSEIPKGSHEIISEPPGDKSTYRSSDPLFVDAPQPSDPQSQSRTDGSVVADSGIEQRINDRVQPGVNARGEHGFDQFDIIPTTPATQNVVATSVPSGAQRAKATTRTEPKRVQVQSVSSPPKLEDFLNGVLRETEAYITNFRQRKPGDGQPASQETSAYLSYDKKNLYVVFVCKDAPDGVRAHLSKREDIANDDSVSVLIDTFHDRRRAYSFSTNPLGIQLDGILTEGQGTDYSFDTLWRSEGQLTPDGYVVSMAIPFKSLRFSSAPVQTWGIALGRTIVRKNEESYWPYITDRVEGFTQQMATLEGLKQISPGRNVQLIPYGSFAHARSLDGVTESKALFRTTDEVVGGLDAKLILHDALTLDLTVNPDFSQVESDEPQVTINRRFEVFFPEKRPFFIENAAFFQTPENLFFSRRIVDPQFGARLTGKLGRWAIGGLAMDDRAPDGLLTTTSPAGNGRALIGVVRVQREVGEQSSVGTLITSQDLASSSNRVFSSDARIKINPNWVFSGQAMRSNTKELDGSRFVGAAYLADLSHSGRHFNYDVTYTDRSPDFRSGLGFIPRVDIRQIQQFANYRWRPKSPRVVSFGPSANMLINWDRQGRLQDSFANAGFGIELPRFTSLEIGRSESFELFQNRGFRTNNTSISFSTEWLKWLALSGTYDWGTGVNFFPSPGLEPFKANAAGSTFGLTLRPSTRLRFDQSYVYNRLGTNQSLPPQSNASASIFNNHIMRSKLNYQFTRALSLRAIVDYNAVLPNTSLVALEQEKRFTTDLLLNYLLNPGTALYIGYTDNRENLRFAPGMPSTLLRIGSPTMATGRQFFVKVSYLLRF